MTAIYITLAVLAYLLIGSVVAIVMVRIEGKESNSEIGLVVFCWGLVVLLVLVFILWEPFRYLAKRIGGVK